MTAFLLVAALLSAEPDAGFITFTNPTEEQRRVWEGAATHIVIGSPELVRIDLRTGQLTYRPGYNPDKAAQIFWDEVKRKAWLNRCGCPTAR